MLKSTNSLVLRTAGEFWTAQAKDYGYESLLEEHVMCSICFEYAVICFVKISV